MKNVRKAVGGGDAVPPGGGASAAARRNRIPTPHRLANVLHGLVETGSGQGSIRPISTSYPAADKKDRILGGRSDIQINIAILMKLHITNDKHNRHNTNR
ncbi:hypothetical protein [Thermus scotoductus]|uniref:hypothetical protein n=1 Tax=Thermus scotoductus TaxID=37636 RepID=UPI000F80E07F|nr:hypothetical protein [Thermus scotoductus]